MGLPPAAKSRFTRGRLDCFYTVWKQSEELVKTPATNVKQALRSVASEGKKYIVEAGATEGDVGQWNASRF